MYIYTYEYEYMCVYKHNKTQDTLTLYLISYQSQEPDIN